MPENPKSTIRAPTANYGPPQCRRTRSSTLSPITSETTGSEDRIERKGSIFDRQRSYSEFGLLDNPKENAKENHRPIFGGSMRFTGKFRFPGKSNSSSSCTSSSSSNSNVAAPRRFSVDENALHQKSSRRTSDGFSDALDSGSECSDIYSGMTMGSPNVGQSARKSGVEVSSKYMNEITLRHRRRTSDSNIANPISGDKSPKLNKFTIKNVIRRAHSLTATTQWALSPGRTGSPTMSVENKGVQLSSSSMKPPTSPSKTKGVEKLLNSGLNLFKSKKSSSSPSSVLVRSNSVSSGSSMTEMGHQLRLLHNRILQWQFANARADVVNQNIANQAQLKSLESWGDMERQHMAAVCTMKECLHSVVCRVPLIDGAEVDTQSASIALRHASNLTNSIKLLLANFSPLVCFSCFVMLYTRDSCNVDLH
ncbi:QWRF motif-containing protein 3-like [Pyrus x bretschneideri]|uniref:QWRF motif-containing protein 3-like n=1 Tax=Pyrus x bretschneideri TaxID=225117 RepID=UPI002030A43F|nr:QWRF motif-containing protein 3-like [Pyrus x bretschneideri]